MVPVRDQVDCLKQNFDQEISKVKEELAHVRKELGEERKLRKDSEEKLDQVIIKVNELIEFNEMKGSKESWIKVEKVEPSNNNNNVDWEHDHYQYHRFVEDKNAQTSANEKKTEIIFSIQADKSHENAQNDPVTPIINVAMIPDLAPAPEMQQQPEFSIMDVVKVYEQTVDYSYSPAASPPELKLNDVQIGNIENLLSTLAAHPCQFFIMDKFTGELIPFYTRNENDKNNLNSSDNNNASDVISPSKVEIQPNPASPGGLGGHAISSSSHPLGFQCTCGKVMKDRKALNEHIIYFNEGKKFACNFQNCGKRFHRNNQLQKHRKKAHNINVTEGKYGCRKCGMAKFATKLEHKRHANECVEQMSSGSPTQIVPFQNEFRGVDVVKIQNGNAGYENMNLTWMEGASLSGFNFDDQNMDSGTFQHSPSKKSKLDWTTLPLNAETEETCHSFEMSEMSFDLMTDGEINLVEHSDLLLMNP